MYFFYNLKAMELKKMMSLVTNPTCTIFWMKSYLFSQFVDLNLN